MFGIFIVSGYLNFYEITHRPKLPEIDHLNDVELKIKSIQTHVNEYENFSPETAWESLQGSLDILDKVCPVVSAWVREKHAQNIIVWESEDSGTYAKYTYSSKELTINRCLFLKNSGFIASVMAHEYRHSLQDFTSTFKSFISVLIYGDDQNIREPEAEHFEYQVYIAVFH